MLRSGISLLIVVLVSVPLAARQANYLPAVAAARRASDQVSQAREKAAADAQVPAPKSTAAPTPPAAQATQTPEAPRAGTTTAQGARDTTTGQKSGSEQLIEPQGFTYSAEGRRDPFVSLIGRGTTVRAGATGSRPAGIAGLGASDVALRGTMRGREGFVAILQGSDQKTYIVRPGDKLFDGTIRDISQNDMVIVQQVNDPLSLEKQREVRKVLRQTEAK